MIETDLRKICFYHIYPIDSKIYSEKRFLIFDIGEQGEIHWVWFSIKDNKSFTSIVLVYSLINF